MEHGKPQDHVLLTNSHGVTDELNQDLELGDEYGGNKGSNRIENEMGHRQPLSVFIGGERTENGGHRSPDICPDGKGQGVDVLNLAGGQCGDNQREGRTARLHDHRGNHSHQDIDSHPEWSSHGIAAKINTGFEGLKSVLHIGNAEENEA